MAKGESRLPLPSIAFPSAPWPIGYQLPNKFCRISRTPGSLRSRLLEGLKDKEDCGIVSGDGAAQHLEGFLADCTAYETARDQTGNTLIDKVNRAVSLSWKN